MLLCCQRSVLGRSRVYPDVIKIFTPTPYSLQGVKLAPFLTRRYAGYRLVPAYPLGNHSATHRLSVLQVLPCHHFLLHLSRPLTRESLGDVCVKNREQAGSAKMNQLVCVLRHFLLVALKNSAHNDACLLLIMKSYAHTLSAPPFLRTVFLISMDISQTKLLTFTQIEINQ